MTFAGSEREVVESLALAVAEFDLIGGDVFLDTGDSPGTGDWSDVLALSQ